ncbi:uncharacterized protein A1O5_07751 [Cladophialophora psammophila CBS 110553]|uniref:Uncharacterized protein n=1 Tax=Cladophialophora psammophila CBS 110553 TaxID=1182543 RepID=W9WUU2_9EURO|nr:uncharacterized protein A1O5_07751 [Cladophialophora psammophila CBS 110553]EXJ68820.1 hypothetical protein A1O5_07751 [Cladophialophora psammophila CBS 110553]
MANRTTEKTQEERPSQKSSGCGGDVKPVEQRTSETSTTTTTTTTTTPPDHLALEQFNALICGDGWKSLDEPPPLPFDVRHHTLSVSIFTVLVLAECCFLPIALYYGLSKGTNMRSGIYFAIITSLFGFVTGYEFAVRSWRLIRSSDQYRPLFGSPRFWGFDSTQYVLMTPFTVMMIILIIFSIPHYPSVRALALPMPVGMIVTGVILVVNGWAAHHHWTLRYFRLSSHVKNSVCPPLTFCLFEDICAVDGKGGKDFRTAALVRYHASPRFRALLMHLLWFWSIPAIVIGAVLIVAIYLTSDDIAYGIGWGAPTVWAVIWTCITVGWARRVLEVERKTWSSERLPLTQRLT